MTTTNGASALHRALEWTAAALQAACETIPSPTEDDVVTMGEESKTIGQVLDEADAALAEGVWTATPPSPPTVEDATAALKIALRDSKGWAQDYSDAIIRDAIDRVAPAEGGVTRQHVADQFGFLEGLVRQDTYTRIVDVAFALSQRQAQEAEPSAGQIEEWRTKADDYDRLANVARNRRRVLEEIAGSRSMTATPQQMVNHLQRLAEKACKDFTFSGNESPPQSPAQKQAAPGVPVDVMGAFRLLVAACIRLDFESEEYDLPDGWGCGAGMEYWSEFRTALERAQEAITDVAMIPPAPAEASQPSKWIDDPHDIEQGQMLNPEWVKLQGGGTLRELAERPEASQGGGVAVAIKGVAHD